MNLADDEVQVTIWDADGNVVVDEVCKCQTATQAEIDDMVQMIEKGTPAHIASILALQKMEP